MVLIKYLFTFICIFDPHFFLKDILLTVYRKHLSHHRCQPSAQDKSPATASCTTSITAVNAPVNATTPVNAIAQANVTKQGNATTQVNDTKQVNATAPVHATRTIHAT
jgi:hypothetical protein